MNRADFKRVKAFRERGGRGWGRGLPEFLGEVLDQLDYASVHDEVKGRLAPVVGVVDVGPFLRQVARDGGPNVQLNIAQETRSPELEWQVEERRKDRFNPLRCHSRPPPKCSWKGNCDPLLSACCWKERLWDALQA